MLPETWVLASENPSLPLPVPGACMHTDTNLNCEILNCRVEISICVSAVQQNDSHFSNKAYFISKNFISSALSYQL